MSVTEHLMRPGSGSLRFVADVPASITDQIVDLIDENAGGVGAAVVITSERVDPDAFGDVGTLDAAIYNGPITGRPSRLSLEFAGLGVWLDSYLDAVLSRSAGTPTQWVGDLAGIGSGGGNGLTVGTITGGSNVSRTFPAHSVSRREALDAWARLAGVDYRINPDFTIDAAAGSTLFVSPPETVVTRHEEGPDGALRGVDGGLLDQALTRLGPSIPTKAVALAQGVGAAIAKGTATRALSLRTPKGDAPAIVTVFSAPSEESANANTAASNFLNLQGMRRQVSVSSETHALPRLVKPGDEVWLWDPTAGLVDLTNQIKFRGEAIFPALVRLLSYTWPIRSGYGVYIRPNSAAPDYIDVTDWVEWEDGATWWTVGDWSPPSYGPTNRSNPEIEERIGIGGVQEWSPTLRASTTDPNMGADGLAEGWYQLDAQMCTMWHRYFWSGAGLSGGSGTYEFELPPGITWRTGFRQSIATFNGMVVGVGAFRDNSAVTATSKTLTFWARSAVGGEPRMRAAYDNGSGQIGQGSPVTIAESDVITVCVSFPWEYI